MIDVIITAYNSIKTLDRTLGSLVSQTNKDFHVIIVDDCSTEDIKTVINRYTDILNMKYIRNSKNMGCGMSRQIGIDNSSEEYITFLDSDDVFMPYTIDVFHQNINIFPDANIFNSYFYGTDQANNIRLIKNALTWCHGRLYKRTFIQKYNIQNLPEIQYSDDSYFNSICDELNSDGLKTIELPMMMWLYNKNSVTRNAKGNFKTACISDFIYGIRKSIEFISKYKSIEEISFIPNTIMYLSSFYKSQYEELLDAEKERIDDELSVLGNLISNVITPEDFEQMFII